ncbi:MAG: FKBP-type peptidyl-prolyl cis-trans isomerase [Bacteroidota bacterium]
MNRLILIFVSLAMLSSCLKEDDRLSLEEQFEKDTQLIEEYLAANNLEAENTESGLHYIIEREGTGAVPEPNQTVRISFQETLLDGTVIAETEADSSISFNISTAIPGLQESLVILKEGGKGTFILPSYLAFGTASSDVLPANSVIIFEIEFHEILTSERQLAIDVGEIEDYLESNNIAADSTASGIYYFFEEEGEGENPTANSTVTVRYKGYFLDGTVFDQTEGDATATFALNAVIRGWTEGIQLFKKGGKGTLIIPSALAYGPNGRGEIPPNTVLAFDIELVNF